jgi:hypothetical protein
MSKLDFHETTAPSMRPAFASRSHAAAFGILILFILLLPVMAGKKLLPPREQAYAIKGWGNGPYPWISRQIFDETNDIDIALVGSSHMLHDVNAAYLQDALSRRLNRPAVVRTIAWTGGGYDALYIITRDLLAHRRVKMLVFYDDDNILGTRNNQIPALFRLAESDGILPGLPLSDQCAFYFAAVIGMPRNLLCLVSPNPPDPLNSNLGVDSVESARRASIVRNLGSSPAELGYVPVRSWRGFAPFVPFTPTADASPADVAISSGNGQGNFLFSTSSIPAWHVHFCLLLRDLLQSHHVQPVMLYLPYSFNAKSPLIEERTDWRKYLGENLVMLGIPPARLFKNLTEDEIHLLYFDPYHLNKNGQDYFTKAITPGLLHIYESTNLP